MVTKIRKKHSGWNDCSKCGKCYRTTGWSYEELLKDIDNFNNNKPLCRDCLKETKQE